MYVYALHDDSNTPSRANSSIYCKFQHDGHIPALKFAQAYLYTSATTLNISGITIIHGLQIIITEYLTLAL